MERLHRPVMVKEVIDFISVNPGGVYADLTFGEGGHSSEILQRGASILWATDRDPEAVRRALLQERWKNEPRLRLTHTEFSGFPDLVPPGTLDGILVDLGVSTSQLLEGERGFSFYSEGPVDMRMNTAGSLPLNEILSSLSAEELADALYKNTGMQKSRSVARRVMEKFEKGEIRTTKDLASLMGSPRPGQAHPATALFLGLRMLVNRELEEIEATLPRLIPLLKRGGRLVVLTFHSTEDRLVKRLFRLLSGMCVCEEEICLCPRVKLAEILTPKPIEPTEEEIRQNPRSRSTKLRALKKL